MEDLVSIIIPVYNTEKYLSKCLESVINQTYKNLEIILINDGSTDKSKEICESFAKKDKRIQILNKENSGVSSARNHGMRLAKGQYIAFIDGDDYAEENYIEELLKNLKQTESDCVLCGYNRVYDKKIEQITKEKNIYLNKEEFLFSILNVQTGTGFTWAKLWKREAIKDVQFDEEVKIGEDALFCMKACKNINKVYILNKALYNYRFNASSAVRKYDQGYADKILKSMQIAKRYIEKEYSKDEEAIKKVNNYIAYHILLISVNFAFNKENNLSSTKQIKKMKEICNIPEFKEGIKSSNYEALSLTRKITLFTIKYKLYFLTMLIARVRQIQFRR